MGWTWASVKPGLIEAAGEVDDLGARGSRRDDVAPRNHRRDLAILPSCDQHVGPAPR